MDTIKKLHDNCEIKYAILHSDKQDLQMQLERKTELLDNLLDSIAPGPLYKGYLGFPTTTYKEKMEVIRHMSEDVELYISEKGNHQIQDYINIIGEDFEPICGLLYKMKKDRGNIIGIREGLLAYLSNHTQEKLDHIVDEYHAHRDAIEELLRTLKDKIMKNGVYCRRVGDTTEYYGLTSEVYEERERYKRMCEEMGIKIKNLVKKLEKLRKPVTEDLLSKIKDFASEDTTLIHEILDYSKKKLYRRKNVSNLFEAIDYKPGMKYAGITISKWQYDYLMGKSLVRVLSKAPEKIEKIEEMRYSIKCLTKLNKLMNAKKAIIWVRNLFAKKLGRKQAGMKSNSPEIQELRFFNTYIFENLSFQEFRDDGEKTIKYMKQYKQLDRELNARYLDRYYSNSTQRAWENNQKKKRDMVFAAMYFKQETGKYIDEMKTKVTKSKRNPLVAYRKLARIVDEKYKHTHTDAQRIEILNDYSVIIPEITYGSENPPKKYVRYCENLLGKYRRSGGSTNDIAISSLKTLRELVHENKRKEEGKEEEEYLSETTTDDEYLDSDYYSDYSM